MPKIKLLQKIAKSLGAGSFGSDPQWPPAAVGSASIPQHTALTFQISGW